MTGEFEIKSQNNGTLIGTSGALTYTGNRAGLIEGYQSPAFGDGTKSQQITVTCTSGTAKIIGILWHTFKNRTLALNSASYNGTWSEEAWDGWGYSHYTDTTGDSMTFEYEGSSAILYLSRKSAGGIVNVYLNGDLVNADLDLYSAGSYHTPVVITSALATDLDIKTAKKYCYSSIDRC